MNTSLIQTMRQDEMTDPIRFYHLWHRLGLIHWIEALSRVPHD
jgi:hypothetical protein